MLKKILQAVKHLALLKINSSRRRFYFEALLRAIYTLNTHEHNEKILSLYELIKNELDSLDASDLFEMVFQFENDAIELNQELSKKNLEFIFDNRRELATLDDSDREWFLETLYNERKKSIAIVESQFQAIHDSFTNAIEEKTSFDLEPEPTKKKRYQ